MDDTKIRRWEHEFALEPENLVSNPSNSSSKFRDLCQITEPL